MFVLTGDEIEELIAWQDLCTGVEVDGQPLNCWDIVVDIVQGNTNADSLDIDQLKILSTQMQLVHGFWDEISWFDSRKLDVLVGKLVAQVEQEIERGKS